MLSLLWGCHLGFQTWKCWPNHWHKYIWTACSQYFRLNFALSVQNHEGWRILTNMRVIEHGWLLNNRKNTGQQSTSWANTLIFRPFDNAFQSRAGSPDVYMSMGPTLSSLLCAEDMHEIWHCYFNSCTASDYGLTLFFSQMWYFLRHKRSRKYFLIPHFLWISRFG